MTKVTKFEQVCIKKDGRISQRARYLFETDKESGRYYLDSDYVVLHPWHVSSGRGFSTVVDNIELIREILKSIKCSFVEGNDAPKGGQSGQFIRFNKRDFLNGLNRVFGVSGRRLYVELGLSSVLTAKEIETLKTMTPDVAAMLASYYKDAWRVINKQQLTKDFSIAVFPDEE